MGNKDSKCEDSGNIKFKKLFKTLAVNGDTLQQRALEVQWSEILDDRLLKSVLRGMFPTSPSLDYGGFCNFATAMLKGNYNDKSEIIGEMIRNHISESEYKLLKMFIVGLIASLVKIEQRKKTKSFASWGFEETADCDRFADYCVRLAGGEKPNYSDQEIRCVLNEIPRFWEPVFNELLNEEVSLLSVFPRWIRANVDGGRKFNQSSMLTMEDILFLNNELPVDWQSEWRLLFSTKIHGESFARILGQMTNQGPTLLIIKDANQYIFGGFAPASWTLNPKFVGDSSSFLFTLQPELNIFPASNFNENYQYLNQHQQTLPNGLGMGGCLEYFGLWLDSEFGKGVSNDSCTTYRQFKRLSKEKEFICEDVEVWGVGSAPATAEELGERSSVLDKNVEAKAFLEMAGKKIYSDGLREDPNE